MLFALTTLKFEHEIKEIMTITIDTSLYFFLAMPLFCLRAKYLMVLRRTDYLNRPFLEPPKKSD